MRVATLLAIVLLALAGPPAWGHTFAPLRTVVIQVERCEVAMLVGYRAGSREEADALTARVAIQPKSHAQDTMRDLLASRAMAPLTLAVDGAPLVPTKVRAKLATDGIGGRPMVVVLVTFALPVGKQLVLTSRDRRTTRISWTDRHSERVAIDEAPAQGKFFSDVAFFLLTLTSPNDDLRGSACATSPRKH